MSSLCIVTSIKNSHYPLPKHGRPTMKDFLTEIYEMQMIFIFHPIVQNLLNAYLPMCAFPLAWNQTNQNKENPIHHKFLKQLKGRHEKAMQAKVEQNSKEIAKVQGKLGRHFLCPCRSTRVAHEQECGLEVFCLPQSKPETQLTFLLDRAL